MREHARLPALWRARVRACARALASLAGEGGLADSDKEREDEREVGGLWVWERWREPGKDIWPARRALQ